MLAASPERGQNLEQYLSENRSNHGLQMPMKTPFSGLSRTQRSDHRRISATINLTTPQGNTLQEIEKIL
jgi:hypothetical protein